MPARRWSLVAPLLVAALAVGGGCSSESDGGAAPAPVAPTAGTDVELPVRGVCGARFWAATASGDLAVTLTLPGRDGPTVEATTYEVDVPDPAVAVQVLRGRDLTRNFCTDALDGASEPTSTEAATAGSGTVALDDAAAQCDPTTGTVDLTGLEAADGTTFAPLAFEATGPYCYGG